MGISRAMKSRGLTVKELANRSGVAQKNLSAYKSGSRTMGRKAAEKLAEVLDEPAEALLIANRAEMMNAAAKRGDRVGVLNAAKAVMKIGDDFAAPGSELSESLDKVVEWAIKYAGTTTPYGDFDYLTDDGRDGLGRKVVTKSFPRSATPEESADEDDEDVDEDGRDSLGRRISPLEGV